MDSRMTIDWMDLDMAVSRGSVGMLQGPIPHGPFLICIPPFI